MNILSINEVSNRSYGGKADGLIFLSKNGFNVPEFFIIDNALIVQIINDNNNLIIENWINENELEGDSLWAVRSSASIEDGIDKSFAGVFSSVLNCSLDDISKAIKEVSESFEAAFLSDDYLENDVQFEGNIIIQRMLFPDISGVGFSKNPLNNTDKNPLLTVLPGLGHKIVSGEEIPMTISLQKKKVLITSTEAIYSGEIFKKEYQKVSQTAQELESNIFPLVKNLKKGLISLENMLGYPVDTEFVIVNKTIFWVQVRPITKIQSIEFNVWDNSNVSSNYPGIIMPITSSFVNHTYSNAYIRMARFLGGGDQFITRNKSLFKGMSGIIYGAMYYNITAWQQLVYQLPFGGLMSKIVTKMWGADDVEFHKPKTAFKPILYLRFFINMVGAFVFFSYYKNKFLRTYEAELQKANAIKLQGKTYQELIDILLQVETRLSDKVFVPVLNGFYTLLFFTSLKKIISKSRLNQKYPNFINDILFESGDVVSVTIVRNLQEILTLIRRDIKLKTFFLTTSPQTVLNLLEKKDKIVFKKIQNYISDYGERCEEGELKIETINYKEDPTKFIEFIQKNLSFPTPEIVKQEKFDYKKILKENYRNPFKKMILLFLIYVTINRVRDRENFRFIRTKSFGIARSLFRQMDSYLLENNKIDHKGDSLYLFYQEIMDFNNIDNFKTIITSRKVEYNAYKDQNHAIRYHEIDNEFIEVENEIVTSECFTGTGCCSGLVEGEVVIVTEKNFQEIEVDGKILIASYFEPGWIGLFARAKGLISERGSLLSHAAILCRELGIPSIIGAKYVLNNIKDNDNVQMNGATGKISKKEKE